MLKYRTHYVIISCIKYITNIIIARHKGLEDLEAFHFYIKMTS